MLNTISVEELLDLGGEQLESHLSRPYTYRLGDRTLEEAMEDRNWGDLSEFAFMHFTGAQFSGFDYQDLALPNKTTLFGHEVEGLIELKTIPRNDACAASTAIQNYFLKNTKTPKDQLSNWFFVYFADRENSQLKPFGLYRRGFANSIEVVWQTED